MKVIVLFFLCGAYIMASQNAVAQNTINIDTLKKNVPTKAFNQKQFVAASIQGGIITSTMIVLNKYWYAQYPKRKFGSFDDSKEWQQMDKMGHVFSAYLGSRLSAEIWKSAEINDTKSAWLGGLCGMLYQTAFEVMDGYSAEYGFSWADIAGNTLGATMFITQQVAWQQQRIQPKLSYTTQQYETSLQPRIKDLYGNTKQERLLKDYNGQTYWLSVNLKSFAPNTKLPAWLNIAVGTGASGMLGGFENKWTTNNIPYTRYDIPRQRQFYLAPDIDFTKIKTKKKGIKILFHMLNLVKLPTPGLELSGGKLKLRGIAY